MLVGISTEAEIAFDLGGAMLRARSAVVVVGEEVDARAQAAHEARLARRATLPAIEHVHARVGARSPAASQPEAHRHTTTTTTTTSVSSRVLRVLATTTTPA